MNSKLGPRPLLTKAEVAARYRRTKRTIDNWAKSGLPYVQTPGGRLYDPAAIDHWLGGGKDKS